MAMDQVEIQSKIIRSVLKAFGVPATVPGIIEAAGGEPEKVFELVRFVQANGERLTQSFEQAVIGTAERVQRMETDIIRQSLIITEMNNMLCGLCERAGIEHSGYLAQPLKQKELPPCN